jgi:murein DD-endopeptidase MepM/ murein hydrolase activator NlpD
LPDSGDDAPQNDEPANDTPEPGPEPVSGNQGVAICPIQGALTFIDSWGDARPGGRSHQGVDLLSPSGTRNVAVASGRIEQDYGDRQGNGIFLYGDNGTTYYYFHLSAYEGSPRHVSQGETIGYVGSTGASGANHTHFEIHPGGGGAINPYPYVSNVC